MKLISGRIVSALAVLLALTTLFLTGCASQQTPQFTSSPAIEPAAVGAPSGGAGADTGTNSFGTSGLGDELITQRFQVADQVTVVFSGHVDTINPHIERIKEDGMITLPLIGTVKALGKTPGELQKEILGLYVPKYYVRLTVVVQPPTADWFFHVSGEVRSPGPKQYLPGTTLTKAISSAGGLTEFARKGKITITRSNGTKITVDYNKAIENPQKDVQVLPNDRVNVPRRII